MKSTNKLIRIVLCLVLCFCLYGCSQNEKIEEIKSIVIDTKYTELYYPEKYKDDVNIVVSEQDPYTVSFYAEYDTKEQILFEIIFNGDKGSEIGFVKVNENVYAKVNVCSYALSEENDWTDSERQLFEELQNGMIYLIDNLKIVDNNIVVGKKTITLDTPLLEIKFPAIWKDIIDIEVVEDDSNRIIFSYLDESGNAKEIFNIYFGKKDENTVGSFINFKKEVFVNIKFADIDTTGMSYEQSKKITAIAEDVNVILSNLQVDYNLKYLKK